MLATENTGNIIACETVTKPGAVHPSGHSFPGFVSQDGLRGSAVVRRQSERQGRWQAATICGALALAMLPCSAANAGGLFDFLFGGQQEQPRAPVESYAEPAAPLGRIAPAPLGAENVRQNSGSTGHDVAFCVRLCDGQHFPLERMNNATPVETCRAMCPASKTKVFFGSEIGGAVAKDGARYADLDVAFIYRKQMVANCTCNGKDAFGLAPFDMANDPTLRPGDIVSTKQGLMAFTGKAGSVAQYTPVDKASVVTALNSVTSHVALSRRAEPAVDDDPGTIAMPQAAPPPVNLGANGRAQGVR
jgi:hypothetical protein